MGRFGEFYDQDAESARPGTWTGPLHAGHGMLYDQEAAVENPRVDHETRVRRRQAEDRQLDRDIELRRQLDSDREREARRNRALEALYAEPPDPVRISSRPGTTPVRIGSRSIDSTPDSDGRPAGARVPISSSDGGTASRGQSARRAHSGARRAGGARPPSTQRATAVLAAGTFASRLTGFARVLAIGYVLGVGSLSDAFNYANGVPNIVYDLLLGGILSATLIPVFVEQLNGEDHEEATRSLSAVLSAIVVALAVITALLWLLAPWVIRFYLILNSTSTGPAERALATRLLHYFAPQVFFLGAIVVTTALLNARRSFTAAAFSPVLNNAIAIAALLVTKFVAADILTAKRTTASATVDNFAHDQRAILILGLGTTAGYVVQFLVQLPALRRAGLHVRLVWDLHHPAVRKVAGLGSWLVGVVLANQASLALVMVLAGKTNGGVTAYNFSYQFFQLPYALIAVSVASSIMPDLAQRWTERDTSGFERQFVAGLRVTLALLIPAGMVYVAVAQPLIQLALHHGRVTQSGAHLVSSSLALFAVGLPGFSAYFLLMRAYQAMQKPRAMFCIYALENGLTLIAALILEPLLGVPGLALAWVGPYTIASIVAAWDLRKRVGPLGGRTTVRALVRVTIASALTVLVVVLVGLPFGRQAGDPILIARLVLQVGVGGLAYLGLTTAMRIEEVSAVIRMARRLIGGR